MQTTHPVDQLNIDKLTEGPTGEIRITITMPTQRAGRDTRAGAIQLGNLAREAVNLLTAEHGLDNESALALTAPLSELIDDPAFWQDQAESLLILLQPNEFSTFRLDQGLPEQLTIGQEWGLDLVLGALDEHSQAHLLAFSRNRVRLFLTDGTRIQELDLGTIPESEDDIYRDRDHQEHLQFSAQGGGELNRHGHGADARADRVQLERFLRHVARGLEERIAVQDRLPLVLACVDSNAPVMREILSWPAITDQIIAGSPDHLEPQQLADAAKPVLEQWRDTHRAQIAKDLDDARSSKRLITDLSELTAAAEEGRLQTLFVAPVEPTMTTSDRIRAKALNHVATATVRNGGRIQRMPDGLAEVPVAIARY